MMKVLSSFIVLIFINISIFGQSYTSYFTGNEEDKSVDDLEFSLTVMGGGAEVDYAMKMFLEDAKGGDVLVLRTSGADGYNDYLYSELGVIVNSVETIVCHSQSASYDPYVLDRILKAEAVWFAGGDQWKYLSYWRDTPLQQYLNFAILDRGMPVGGTSAGMAIMGQYQFTAENGTVTSEQALADPYNDRMTIDNRPFLIMPLPVSIIFDSHFDDPDRRGRMLTFLARIKEDYGKHVVGIGLEEYTAARLQGGYMTMLNDNWDDEEDFTHVFSYDCNVDPLDFIVEPDSPLTWSGNHLRYRKFRSSPSLITFINLLTGSYNVVPDVNVEISIIDGAVVQVESSMFEFPMLCSPISSSTITIEDHITISPNPAYSALSVETNGELIDRISIYSDDGKIVYYYESSQSDKCTLDISTLRSGLYFMNILTENKQVVRKIVKL